MDRNRRRWTTSDIPPQTGRRALVTGANSGIGFHAALELARKVAEIIMPARTQAKAEEAIRRIRREVHPAKLIPEILDLADLGSVRTFAERFLKRFASASLDLLINNAGVYALGTRQVTSDGFERQFATNYIGPFVLTALLFPSIKPTLGSRVVTVASIYSKSGKIDFDNLQSERSYRPVYGAYATSKLADLMFGLELQNLLTRVSSPIASICAHPGYSITNIKKQYTALHKISRCSPTALSCAECRSGSTANTLRGHRAHCSGRRFLLAGLPSGNKRISRSSQDSCSSARPFGWSAHVPPVVSNHPEAAFEEEHYMTVPIVC